MSIPRKILLWSSQNAWMKRNIPRLFFVKKALRRFMPGETVESALSETEKLYSSGIRTVFTKLGENINTLSEAETVTTHYLDVLSKIERFGVPAEISLKLTQIGFDISEDAAAVNFEKIIRQAAEQHNFIWIDMEQSSYTQRTIDFYRQFRKKYINIGICLQAYLKSTQSTVKELLPISPNIRLVKGAYMEPAELAFSQKSMVDKNYLELARILLNNNNQKQLRMAFATHDLTIISGIKEFASANNIGKNKFEFQMLYGIKPSEQLRIAREGYNIRVLISYGEAWYSWYMRRLAERPANVGFVLKNLFTQ